MTTAPAHVNGRALGPLPVHDLAPAWLQRDSNGHGGTVQDSPEPSATVRRRPDGDTVIRVLAAAVVLAVAAFAAIVSYSHIFELGRHHGQDGTAARLLPLSVDGLIAAASLVMLHAARRKLPVPSLARSMLALGVLATIAANIFYGLPFGWLSAVVSAWPAVAFVGSVEMAVRFVRDARQDGDTGIQPDCPRCGHRGHPGTPMECGWCPEGYCESGGWADKPVDGGQDKTADKQADKSADKTGTEVPPTSKKTRTEPRTTGRPPGRAADIIRRHPDWTDEQVTKAAGCHPKTVRRARDTIDRSTT